MRYTLSGLLVALFYFGTAASHAAPPLLATDNVHAYRIALEHSKDRKSHLLLQEIASGPQDLAKAKAAALKDGILLTKDSKTISQGNNAWPLYEKWHLLDSSALKEVPIYAQPMFLSHQYTPEQIALVQKLINNSKDSDQVLMEAIKKPLYIESTEMSPKYFGDFFIMREAARYLRTEATLLAINGDWKDATNIQAKGLLIQRQLDSQDNIYSFLVSVAVGAISIRGLQDILERSEPDADFDEMVSNAVTESENHLLLKDALQGEPVGFLSLCDSIPKECKSSPKPRLDKTNLLPQDKAFIEKFVDAFEAHYLNRLRLAVEVAAEPSMQRRIDLANGDKQSEDESGHYHNDLAVALLGDDNSSLMFSPLAKQDDVRMAREQVTLAAAAVLALKARTGSFPSALPGTFSDPFSGQSLVYKLETNGFVVYSVGPTGHFDGKVGDGDIGFESLVRYPAPPPEPVPQDLLRH